MNVVNHSTQGDIGILTIEQARLLDDANLRDVQKQLLELLDHSDAKKIILDFHLVDFVSSAGLGMLIRVKKRCTDGGKALRLCSLEPTVAETIRITGLEQLFQIEPDVTQAIVAFEKD